MNTKKAKVIKDKVNGLYDVVYPDGSKKWYYTKAEAVKAKDKFNSNIK
jgi:hypothetical protein